MSILCKIFGCWYRNDGIGQIGHQPVYETEEVTIPCPACGNTMVCTNHFNLFLLYAHWLPVVNVSGECACGFKINELAENPKYNGSKINGKDYEL